MNPLDARVVWHKHVFAALCVRETHGRFDAIEDDLGRIFVLDVGAGAIVRRCRSRKQAVAAAKVAADRWDRNRRAKRDRDKKFEELGDFFRLLGEAHSASEEVDYFDLHSQDADSQREFDKLEADQGIAVSALVGFLKTNGDAVVAALRQRRNLRATLERKPPPPRKPRKANLFQVKKGASRPLTEEETRIVRAAMRKQPGQR